MQFKELGLSDELLSAVKSMGFDEMTEIQEKSIPVIMKGLDCCFWYSCYRKNITK